MQEYETVAPRQKKKQAIKKKVISFFRRLFNAILAVAKLAKKVILRRKDEAKLEN